MHSRFEHSLGVMELVSRAFDRLRTIEPKAIDCNLKKLELTWQEAKATLRMAALLHDIGHLPFSHGAEGVLPKGIKHEDVGFCVIESFTAPTRNTGKN
jgi:HD superfamily phosphohydrolase